MEPDLKTSKSPRPYHDAAADSACPVCLETTMDSPVVLRCCGIVQCRKCAERNFVGDAKRVKCWGRNCQAEIAIDDLLGLSHLEAKTNVALTTTTAVTTQSGDQKRKKARSCLICKGPHVTARCPTLVCNRCQKNGHAAISCLNEPRMNVETTTTTKATTTTTIETFEMKPEVLMLSPSRSTVATEITLPLADKEGVLHPPAKSDNTKTYVGKIRYFKSGKGQLVHGSKKYKFFAEEDSSFLKDQYVLFEKIDRKTATSVRYIDGQNGSRLVIKDTRKKKRKLRVKCKDNDDCLIVGTKSSSQNVIDEEDQQTASVDALDDDSSQVLHQEIQEEVSPSSGNHFSILFVEGQLFRYKGHEQFSQLGAVLLKDGVVETLFRPIRISPQVADFRDLHLIGHSQDGTSYRHPKGRLLPCFWEDDSLKDFLELCRKDWSSRPLLLYFSHAEKVFPFLLQQLKKYDLWTDFCSLHVKVFDLHSALGIYKEWKCLQTFCWTRIRLIYRELMGDNGEAMPQGPISAEILAQVVWIVTEKLFDGIDLEKSETFQKLFKELDLRHSLYITKSQDKNTVQSCLELFSLA